MARIIRQNVLALTWPGGPLGRNLSRKGLRVQNKARVLCPVDRGRLRASITATDPQLHPFGLIVAVGSNVEYALAVHDPAKYGPRSWKTAAARGRPVRARRYLTNALPAAAG